jgi:amino acid permease
LVEKIQKLRFLALIGVSAISLFVVSVVYNFFKKTSGWNLPDTLHAFPTENPLKAIASIPNILLAFLYQMNFFPIFKGMKNASDKRMTTASWVASGACYIIYVSVAFLGYMTYGNNSDPDKAIQPNFLNILQREEIGDWLYIIMNLVFMISVLCSFPVIFFGARNNFIAFINSLQKKGDREVSHSRQAHSVVDEISEYLIDDNKLRKKRKARIYFYILTFTLFASIVALAVTVGKLGPIFNLVGAIASNSIGFIFPTLFYVVIVMKRHR